MRDVAPALVLEIIFRAPPLFLAAAPDREAVLPVVRAVVLLEEVRLEDFDARPADCFFPPRPPDVFAARLDVREPPPPADFFPPRAALVPELTDVDFRLEVPLVPPFRADPLDEDFAAGVTARDFRWSWTGLV